VPVLNGKFFSWLASRLASLEPLPLGYFVSSCLMHVFCKVVYLYLICGFLLNVVNKIQLYANFAYIIYMIELYNHMFTYYGTPMECIHKLGICTLIYCFNYMYHTYIHPVYLKINNFFFF